MLVRARLPGGKTVPHGRIEMGVYTRNIPSHYVRYSDRSFCINSTVLPKLKKYDVKKIRMIWSKKEEKVICTILMEEAIRAGRFVVNEQGEENLRIPIDEFRIEKRIPNPGYEPKQETSNQLALGI